MMRKILKITIVIVLFSTLFIGLGSYLSLKEQVVFTAEIEDLFLKAISLDLEERLNDSELFYSFGSMDVDFPSKENLKTFINEDSIIYIEKDSHYQEKEFSQRMEITLQGALQNEGFPMQTFVLDSIFDSKLQKKGYLLTTGVRYINNQTKEIEEYDPANILSKSRFTQKHLLSESGDISIQGFYTLPFSAVFHQAPLPFILLFIAWLITITGYTFLTLRKKSAQEIAFIAISDISKPLGSDPVIQVSEEYNLYFDPLKSRLYYQEDKFIEFSNQPAILFLAFLEAPEHFLTNEQIKELFWEKMDDTRHLRTQAIKRLREDLRPVTLLSIDNINRNGYKLLVVPQE